MHVRRGPPLFCGSGRPLSAIGNEGAGGSEHQTTVQHYRPFAFQLNPHNSGPARAAKTHQKVAGVREDGHAGEQTLTAVREYPGGCQQTHSGLRRFACASFARPQTQRPASSGNLRGWTIAQLARIRRASGRISRASLGTFCALRRMQAARLSKRCRRREA